MLNPMSELKNPSDLPRDQVEELVFLYLEEREEGLVRNFDEFAQRHSSSSAEVRERILNLERAGLLGGENAEAIPERLGNFRLLERLGHGGMGVVYLAEEITLGRRVAVKVIRPEQIYFGQAKERFRREVEATAKLSHPGIVQIFSFAEDNGVPFFAMELVEGASLGDVLKQFAGRAPDSLSAADLARAVQARCGIECAKAPMFEGSFVRSCLEIARQIAVALEHAHARGVIHRDIKPSNVMITPDGRARLLDFGLASRAGAERLTKSGAQLGSLPYMPPELIDGRVNEAGPRSDVYSLGATLFESLALSLPFQADSAALLAQRIATGEHASLRRLNPGVSLDAETICNVAMELDPARRYATAGALASDLAGVLERRPIAARRTSAWLRARRWVERNPAGTAAGFLGALVLLGGPLGYGILQARAADKEHGLNEELRGANQTVRATNISLASAKTELETKNADLATSLAREGRERTRAQRNFQYAFEAINELLATVGSDDLREVPTFEPVRKTLVERALAFYGRLLVDDPHNLAVEREIARVTRSIGDVYEDLGQSDQAIAEYLKAVELSRQVLAVDPDSVNSRHVLASNMVQLARKYQQVGDLKLARAAYEEVLPIAEKLSKEVPENPRFAHDLSAVLLNLGGIDMSAGKDEQALSYRTHAVEVLRPVLEQYPDDPEFIGQFVTCLNGLSNCERRGELTDEARVHLREAWTLGFACLGKHPDVRNLQTNLLEVAVNYGLELAIHDPIEAERVLLKGVEIGRRLTANFPEDLRAGNGLVAVANNLGYHLTNQSRWNEAQQIFDEAVLQSERLLKLDSARIELQCTLAIALGDRSTSLLGLDRIDEARADADRAVEISERVRRALPKHPLVLGGLAVCLMQRAEVECKFGDWPTALETTRTALELGVRRSDISFQAFELFVHIDREAEKDPGLLGDERKTTLDELRGSALEHLERAIQQGFDDAKRLETHPDYEGLRSDPRFAALASKLAGRAK